ncbi:hypothetical protein LCM20_12715 [Halobacillus litoralis]|uniref:dimethylarginine dimethylaminohydrolase family protein n=1 Tax=Halobacillus litoralis TaxID=45668 RepID=UPI001CD7BA37|nr:arginine deiminase family protein [Halobacillus litoralis]MCA0971460.1 hypothetical protein [Halobacillus litoralis]
MEDAMKRRTIGCTTEFQPLKSVIVAPPTYMRIESIMNETQKHFKKANIDQALATEQHQSFIRIMREHHIEVIELSSDPELNEQVFTRDIGFTIGNHLYLGVMDEPLRKKEPALLKDWATLHTVPFEELTHGTIEGGDVVMDGSTVWVGRSGRTTKAAIEELKKRVEEFNVEEVKLKEGVLHLDCAFNVLDESTAIVYPPAFHEEDVQRIKGKFTTIEVTEEEYFTLGPNVLSIGNRKIISLEQNKRVNQKLREKGFHVIEIDFSEIIKSGGSFRCCSLPLYRKEI